MLNWLFLSWIKWFIYCLFLFLPDTWSAAASRGERGWRNSTEGKDRKTSGTKPPGQIIAPSLLVTTLCVFMCLSLYWHYSSCMLLYKWNPADTLLLLACKTRTHSITPERRERHEQWCLWDHEDCPKRHQRLSLHSTRYFVFMYFQGRTVALGIREGGQGWLKIRQVIS